MAVPKHRVLLITTARTTVVGEGSSRVAALRDAVRTCRTEDAEATIDCAFIGGVEHSPDEIERLVATHEQEDPDVRA